MIVTVAHGFASFAIAATCYARLMNKDEKRRPQKSTPTVSRIALDGRIIELVYRHEERKTSLAVYRGGQISYETVVELDAGESLVPVSPDHNLIKHGVLV